MTKCASGDSSIRIDHSHAHACSYAGSAPTFETVTQTPSPLPGSIGRPVLLEAFPACLHILRGNAGRVSTNGQCGTFNDNSVCPATMPCCSSFNVCDNTLAACGSGCQSTYAHGGTCSASPTPVPRTFSAALRHAETLLYASPRPLQSVTHAVPVSTDGTCGVNRSTCMPATFGQASTSGPCCSSSGFCGPLSDSASCGSGCQPGYGYCNPRPCEPASYISPPYLRVH